MAMTDVSVLAGATHTCIHTYVRISARAAKKQRASGSTAPESARYPARSSSLIKAGPVPNTPTPTSAATAAPAARSDLFVLLMSCSQPVSQLYVLLACQSSKSTCMHMSQCHRPLSGHIHNPHSHL